MFSILFALPAALLLVLTTATNASAHYVYEDDITWANADSSACVWEYAEVSHGGRGGYTKTQGRAATGGCLIPHQRPTKFIAAKYKYYKYNKGKKRWEVCRQIGEWQYRKSKGTSFTLSYNFGVAPPCGGGYYATRGYGAVKYFGSFEGKSGMWSGKHYIEP